MAIAGNSNKMLWMGINKALDWSRIHSVTRAHGDLGIFSLEMKRRESYVCLCIGRVRANS